MHVLLCTSTATAGNSLGLDGPLFSPTQHFFHSFFLFLFILSLLHITDYGDASWTFRHPRAARTHTKKNMLQREDCQWMCPLNPILPKSSNRALKGSDMGYVKCRHVKWSSLAVYTQITVKCYVSIWITKLAKEVYCIAWVLKQKPSIYTWHNLVNC